MKELKNMYMNDEKKRLLLVTIQDNGNIGNRLQNYALQTVLENMGAQVDNLTVYHELWELRQIQIKNKFKRLISFIYPNKYLANYCRTLRKEGCISFTLKYIHGIKYVKRDQVANIDWTEYDCAVAGSDQIWHNWHRMDRELDFFYLSFMPEFKRVAYAPSFGFEAFPKEDVETHKKGLYGFNYLSCREQEGCELIQSLSGRKAEKVLDPTLLLSVKECEKLERRPLQMKRDHYVLCFFIGEITSSYKDEVKRICDKRGIDAFYFNDLKDPYRYKISPQEFIWLIHHADTVCTDSFHASVFSILFERRLRVFERVNHNSAHMFGRLRDLLNPLGLMKNVYGEEISGDMETQLSDDAFQYLKKAREDSINYLSRAINVLN